jgi:hypothetical protein
MTRPIASRPTAPAMSRLIDRVRLWRHHTRLPPRAASLSNGRKDPRTRQEAMARASISGMHGSKRGTRLQCLAAPLSGSRRLIAVAVILLLVLILDCTSSGSSQVADQEIVAYCRGPYCVLSYEAVAANQ